MKTITLTLSEEEAIMLYEVLLQRWDEQKVELNVFNYKYRISLRNPETLVDKIRERLKKKLGVSVPYYD